MVHLQLIFAAVFGIASLGIYYFKSKYKIVKKTKVSKHIHKKDKITGSKLNKHNKIFINLKNKKSKNLLQNKNFINNLNQIMIKKLENNKIQNKFNESKDIPCKINCNQNENSWVHV